MRKAGLNIAPDEHETPAQHLPPREQLPAGAAYHLPRLHLHFGHLMSPSGRCLHH